MVPDSASDEDAQGRVRFGRPLNMFRVEHLVDQASAVPVRVGARSGLVLKTFL